LNFYEKFATCYKGDYNKLSKKDLLTLWNRRGTEKKIREREGKDALYAGKSTTGLRRILVKKSTETNSWRYPPSLTDGERERTLHASRISVTIPQGDLREIDALRESLPPSASEKLQRSTSRLDIHGGERGALSGRPGKFTPSFDQENSSTR